jgi:hypothetical protein
MPSISPTGAWRHGGSSSRGSGLPSPKPGVQGRHRSRAALVSAREAARATRSPRWAALQAHRQRTRLTAQIHAATTTGRQTTIREVRRAWRTSLATFRSVRGAVRACTPRSANSVARATRCTVPLPMSLGCLRLVPPLCTPGRAMSRLPLSGNLELPRAPVYGAIVRALPPPHHAILAVSRSGTPR